MNFLKDPWKLFTAMALVCLSLLIGVSQFWILRTSFQQEGGELTITTDRKTGGLYVEQTAVKGFHVDIPDSRHIVLSQNGNEVCFLEAVASGTIRITYAGFDEKIGIGLKDTELILEGKSLTLQLSQKIFGNLFSGNAMVAPLHAIPVGPSQIEISYHPGAYLHIADKSKHFTFDNYKRFLQESKYLEAIRNSLIVMISSTLLGAVFGVGLAYVYARFRLRGTSFVITMITMASISPPFLGAYAWRILLGSSGIITRALGLNWSIVGMHGVIWVIAWLVFPIIFLLSYDSFTSLDHSLRECSMSLGGDRRKTLFKVEIPLAMPGIINGLYMAMMTSFTDFGTPYVISLNLNVLPVMIYKEYMNEIGGNLSIASAGSMLMVFLSFLLLSAQKIYLARRSYASIKTHQPSVRLASPKQKLASGIVTFIILFCAFIPHLTVLITSFFEWKVGILTNQVTVANYTRLFRTNLNSIWVTLFTGGVATALNFVFGIGIAYVIVKKKHWKAAGWLNQLVMVPYLIPGTVLGIGFILMFNQKPILLTGTWLILVLAYFVRKLPYSVKSAESALYQVHSALGEAAESLGAKPLRSFWQITFPLMIGGVISGMTLSFLQIMTEISATIILYRPPWKPMTAVVFENTIDAGSDFGVASAMTVLLMVMLYVPLYIVTIKTRKPKEARIESI